MPRAPMSEEDRIAFGERMKAARQAKKAAEKAKAEEEANMTLGQRIDAIKKEIESESEPAPVAPAVPDEKDKKIESMANEMEDLKKMLDQLRNELAGKNQPQVIQMMSNNDTDRVVMRFQADVADDNLTVFGSNGMYGQVTGRQGTVVVPKSEWSRFYNESVRRMIDRRWLVVLSGMTDEERVLYHCNYKDGEVLDENAFARLLDMGRELLVVFPNLCDYHQEMVARKFVEAYEAGDDRAKDRDLVVALNRMSKENGQNKNGLFREVIEKMNESELA